LVGGFGESLYLKEAISAAHTGIQVIQPHGAWSAIVKGAALSKLPQVAVVSSVAERHYGVTAGGVWDGSRDQGREKMWDRLEGVWRAEVMTWFINKHDDLERDRAVSHPFYESFSLQRNPDDYSSTITLQMCSTDKPPVHPNKAVQPNCTLHVDLSNIPKTQFKESSGPEGKYLKLNYRLLVKIEGARMVFSFECGGKEYASVQADY